MLRAFLFSLSILLPAAASAQVFDCTPTNYGSGGFVSNRIILALDREANAGSAFDYFIEQSNKTPIPVEITKRDENSYVFSWKVRNVEIINEGSGILSHHVTLYLNQRTFTLRGRLHGYDNVISASGKCKLVR